VRPSAVAIGLLAGGGALALGDHRLLGWGMGHSRTGKRSSRIQRVPPVEAQIRL